MRTERRLPVLRRLYREARRHEPAIVHCHEPDSLAVALALHRSCGSRVIFDAHERYDASFLESRTVGLVERLLAGTYRRVTEKMLPRVDALITVSRASPTTTGASSDAKSSRS